MNIGPKWVAIGTWLLLCATFAAAQNGTNNDHLWRLQDCITYAVHNNIQLTTQALNRNILGEQYLQSKAAVLPDLYGSASQDLRHTGNNLSSTGRDISTSGSLGLNSTLNLYKGGYLREDIGQKKLQVQSSDLTTLEKINDLTIQVTQAFLAILLDKEHIIYAQDILNTTVAQSERAKKMYAVGSISRKELAQSQAQLAQDRYNLTGSISDERRDRILLKQLLQLPDTTFDIKRPDTIANAGVIMPLQEVATIALTSRPEIKDADVRMEIAKKELAKARTTAKPSLDLRSGVGTSYSNDPNTTLIRQFDNNFYQVVGLALSVPIFTKRINRTSINIAKIGIEQAELNRNNTRITLELNIELAFVNVLNAQNQYDAALTELTSAREVYNIANEELRIGSINMTDLLVQRNQYIQALQNYLNAKYNAALAARIYDFYRGIPITMD